jgi:hypothetical protein
MPSRSFKAHSTVLNASSAHLEAKQQQEAKEVDQTLVWGIERRMHKLQDKLEGVKHNNTVLSVSDRLWRKEKQKLCEKLAVLEMERSNRALVEIELRRELHAAKNEAAQSSEVNRQLRVELSEAIATKESLHVDLKAQRAQKEQLESTCLDLERSTVEKIAVRSALEDKNSKLSEEVTLLRLQLSESQRQNDNKRRESEEVVHLMRVVQEEKQKQTQAHEMLQNLRGALQDARDTLSSSDVEHRDYLVNLEALSRQNDNLDKNVAQYKSQTDSYRELVLCQQNDIADLESKQTLLMDTHATHHRLFAKEIKACVQLVQCALERWSAYPSLTKAEMNRLTEVDESLYDIHAVPRPSSSSSSRGHPTLRKGLLRVKKVILELFVALSRATNTPASR